MRITIPDIDAAAAAAAARRLDRLTKPQGSLGRLEELAIRLAGMTGNPSCRFDQRAVVVMAADHGVTEEAVSAYPSEVTAQMVANFAAGGAGISVLARRAGAQVVVVDMGVRAAPGVPGVLDRRLGPGTRNMTREPAMTLAQAEAAVATGRELAGQLAAAGVSLFLTGEMGIGNTTAASAVTAALTGRPAQEVTGRGTGLDDAALAHKVGVVERALALHRPNPADPIGVLASVGGFEIAGLAGLILGAAERRIPVILDGFITGAAALAACAMAPGAPGYLIASHRSVEPGHTAVLEALGLEPLLDLRLRLGEGTGAALALHLVDAALAVRDEMATFDEAGVSERTDG
ncbi:nicotinate-nucleotide--dimethylbenzimidazole phosphoribosyltransferase [Tepidiforma sp.]|uniref:nicotinate-nucleotide--dimethylbenzimidazole phosphoribosyltransferase n=1 Tax=Tepidiforma sp. TaxID=2682230 RepID=UPI0026235C4C|nr:nicotinate-nucleotide--dimethylbenzimidazole phosphoribosyltransferase [Tepidiforma sp.]MCX7616333.1 nicotinate-nucleotide--dimethylbenzimidazole phosphoribosyltransferase [Tepidiforma sp.]